MSSILKLLKFVFNSVLILLFFNVFLFILLSSSNLTINLFMQGWIEELFKSFNTPLIKAFDTFEISCI